MRLQRPVRRVLVVLLTTAAMLALLVTPAHAGEAARHCEPYYAQGNTSSPWHFTVCVKLVHDTNTHEWWGTASVSSTTPGIRLYLDTLFITVSDYGVSPMQGTTLSGSGSDFVTAKTWKVQCSGTHDFTGYAEGHAIWPNGVRSGYGEAYTASYPDPYTGSC